MNSEIKISVIIPVYNVQQYLEDCLESVINQSLKEIEIIIINDGSTDGSLNICKKYAHIDSRIVLLNKKNEGVWAARNDGLKCATGEFVSFLDSDDMFSNENALKTLYDSALKHKVLISGGRREQLYPDGHVKRDGCVLTCNGVRFEARGVTKYKDYQYDYGYWCYIYSRKLLTENSLFFPPYQRFQDPPFFVKAMYLAEDFYMSDVYVYRYRVIDGDEKYTDKKTIDQLQGVIDNIVFSKNHNLPKLHYVSAIRLNTECCYMVSRNLESALIDDLLRLLLDANSCVDDMWLKQQGFPIQSPFVVDLFKHLTETTKKYERLRNNKILKLIRRILGK